MLNKAIIVGNLGQDPEKESLRMVQSLQNFLLQQQKNGRTKTPGNLMN